VSAGADDDETPSDLGQQEGIRLAEASQPIDTGVDSRREITLLISDAADAGLPPCSPAP
jgi:hypothetical protein